MAHGGEEFGLCLFRRQGFIARLLQVGIRRAQMQDHDHENGAGDGQRRQQQQDRHDLEMQEVAEDSRRIRRLVHIDLGHADDPAVAQDRHVAFHIHIRPVGLGGAVLIGGVGAPALDDLIGLRVVLAEGLGLRRQVDGVRHQHEIAARIEQLEAEQVREGSETVYDLALLIRDGFTRQHVLDARKIAGQISRPAQGEAFGVADCNGFSVPLDLEILDDRNDDEAGQRSRNHKENARTGAGQAGFQGPCGVQLVSGARLGHRIRVHAESKLYNSK